VSVSTVDWNLCAVVRFRCPRDAAEEREERGLHQSFVFGFGCNGGDVAYRGE